MHRDIPKITTELRSPTDVSEIEVEGSNPALIKAHGNCITSVVLFLIRLFPIGALMMFAWYFIAPVGIFLAFFYKEAFPNGLWFYVSPHDCENNEYLLSS